jgi:glucose/arabinose dehydrogenase
MIGAFASVDPADRLTVGVRVDENRPPVRPNERSLRQTGRAWTSERLRDLRLAVEKGTREITWAMGLPVSSSWVLETNFINLVVLNHLPHELRMAARAVGGKHTGSLERLTSDEFVVVTRNGWVLVYRTNDLVLARRAEIAGIVASRDAATGISDIAMVSSTPSEAHFVASVGRTVDAPTGLCTRIEIVAFTLALAGRQGERQSVTSKSLWTSRECVPQIKGYSGASLGARLWFDAPRRHLYLTLGDLGATHPTGSVFGSLLDFPMEGDQITGEPDIVSKGFRNPAGVAVAADRVWVVNQGPKGGDSLDLAAAGTDFGWPKFSYGMNYVFNGDEYVFSVHPPPSQVMGEFTAPGYVWVPSVALSDLDVNRTTSLGAWFNEAGTGDLLATSLKGESLERCRVSARTGQVAYCESIKFGERLRDVLSLDRAIIVLGDGGNLFKLTGPT